MDLTEQRVTWAELFLDLVWVFAVTQIAGVLATARGPVAVLEALLLLAPLWWGWVGVTLLGNLTGARLDGARGRLTLFALAGCGLGMAVAAPHGFSRWGGLALVGFYALLRLLLWLAAIRITGARHLDPFSVTLLVSCPLYVVGALLDGPWRLGFWFLAAFVGPFVFRPKVKGHRYEASHLPERFGLFVIIALGESIVAVGGQATGAPSDWATIPLALVLTVGLWWTYFHYGAPAVRHALETDPVQARIVRQVFSVAHFGYVFAIILIAVGLKKTVGHPFDVPHKTAELLLAPGVALYLFGFCYARWRMFGAALWPRFGGALVCVGLAFAAPYLPQFGTAALATAVLLAVNGIEAWIVETGRTLPVVALRRG
ncbi:low temperature requirement protein A [Longispora urticae]